MLPSGRIPTLLRVLGAAVCALAVALPAQADWPTTWFEVSTSLPFDGTGDLNATDRLRALVGLEDEVAPAAVRQAEELLHVMALQYEDMGFRAPRLEIVDRADGVKAYRVYLADYPDQIEEEDGTRNVAIARVAAPSPSFNRWTQEESCVPRETTVMMLDASRMVKNGRIQNSELEHLAHELFHTVQAAYPMFQDCNLGKWIKEGTAQAVGIDMLYLRKGIEPSRRTGAIRRWGLRNYNSRLRIGPDPNTFNTNEAYQTSSLWRFIGEWVAGNKPPSNTEITPDYRYLHDFFLAGLPGRASESNELKWLDTQIRETLGMDLADLQARMVPTLVGFQPPRIAASSGSWSAASRAKLVGLVLGDCKKTEVHENASSPPIEIDLKTGGSACIEVTGQNLSSSAEVSINATAPIKDQLKQIQIGRIGGELVSVASSIGQAGDEWAAEWKFALGTTPATFILTNMAQKAEFTERLAKQPFQLNVQNWDANMTSASESPAGEAKAESVEDLARQARSGTSSPTRQAGRSVAVGSDPPDSDPGCEARLEAYNLCGPQTKIELMTVPGLLGDTEVVSGAGGFIGRSAGVARGSTDMSDAEMLAAYGQYVNVMMSSSGNGVSISFPRVDYGFTGTVNRARISVMLAGGKTGDAIELSPGENCNRMWIPNGTVTIEEYTPMVFRGTFSGSLVENGSVKMDGLCNVTEMRSAGGISGSYTVPAPWKFSREGAPSVDLMMDQTRDDVAGILRLVPEDMRQSVLGGRVTELCMMGFSGEELASLGIQGSCEGVEGFEVGAAANNCDCDCQGWERVGEACRQVCEPRWQSWQCGPYLETGLGELDAETQRYQSELLRKGLAQNEANSRVVLFRDGAPDLRANLWQELEQIQTLTAPGLEEIKAEIQKEQAQRRQNYDAETLRFQAAMKEAGYTQAEIDGITEVFAISPEAIRQVFWDDVRSRLGN